MPKLRNGSKGDSYQGMRIRTRLPAIPRLRVRHSTAKLLCFTKTYSSSIYGFPPEPTKHSCSHIVTRYIGMLCKIKQVKKVSLLVTPNCFFLDFWLISTEFVWRRPGCSVLYQHLYIFYYRCRKKSKSNNKCNIYSIKNNSTFAKSYVGKRNFHFLGPTVNIYEQNIMTAQPDGVILIAVNI